MHPKNRHLNGYDLIRLTKVYPPLKKYIVTNQFAKESLDFKQAGVVKALNTALLKADYNISYWDFPISHLCPPIPGRADYLLYLNELLIQHGLDQSPIKILDIGTGATLIYPLLGCRLFNWQFKASDINPEALQNAQNIIAQNHLQNCIHLMRQNNRTQLLKGIILPDEKFSASICNPPFFDSPTQALKTRHRKQKNLKIKDTGFKGLAKELWTPGGELQFVKKYINESQNYKHQIKLFSSLISSQKNLAQLIRYIKRAKIFKYEVIKMTQGHKQSHILVWYF